MKYGLLGRKLAHSYSPAIHQQFGNFDYGLFEVEPNDLETFLQRENYQALNVTIPYKKAVIPYLDELTEVAQTVGAVNTIYRKDGKLVGHNTDYFGFQQMIHRSGMSPNGKKCLVLGSGGASDVVKNVLTNMGAQVIIISRHGENNYHNLALYQDASIIVNATPVGMFPHCGESLINMQQFHNLEGVLDLIYNPARTKLLLEAESCGIRTENGLWMLINQAREAAQIMMSTTISDQQAESVYHKIQQQTENIVLIGMPGCGKSTVGKELAQRSKKAFVDVDTCIEQKAEKSIPQIFAEDGEEAFRALETQVLQEIGKQSGLVIATGGGCVTKPHNYHLLHQNGTIFWLQRELDKLPNEGRPLSQAISTQEMYARRSPLYEAFADAVIDNNSSVTTTVNAILEKFT